MEIYTIGNLTADVILLSVKDFPGWGTEVFIDELDLRCGGNLGNIIFPLKKLHINPAIMGNLGNDYFGVYILDKLKNSGFSTKYIVMEKDVPTSVSVSIVNKNGERALITQTGQLVKIDGHFLDGCLESIKENSIVILCSIFQFPNLKLKDIESFFKKLLEKRCITMLDTGWDPDGWKIGTLTEISSLLKYVDFFLPNLSEAKKITEEQDEKEVLKYFSNLGVKNTIIKKGPRGATAMIGGRIIQSKAYPLKCLDSTGAGDSFNAAIIYCLKNGFTPEKMLDFSNAAASIFVSRPEDKFPYLEEIEEIIKKMNINKTEKLNG